jgi:calpain-7
VDLKLSENQVEIFAGWKRPDAALKLSSGDSLSNRELSDLLMASGRHDIDLVQDITTDCSVVASLCAATARGLKGHGKVRIARAFVMGNTNAGSFCPQFSIPMTMQRVILASPKTVNTYFA